MWRPGPSGSSGRTTDGSAEEGPAPSPGCSRGPCGRGWGAGASSPGAGVRSVRWKPPHSNRRGPIRARRAGPFERAPQPASRSRLRDTGAGRGRLSLLPRLQGSNTDASGCRRAWPGRSGAAMERSLHRVSLGSRRAHPDSSFYLTTFGKCPRRLAARAASPHSGARVPPLVPSSWGCPGGGAQGVRAQAEQAAGHHLLPASGAKCSRFCLAWLE